ncbi:transcription initiation protein [Ilyomonas limi]|uniref:Transcription initiation protein n=1 Tax=Ilyomonas limi TaxID=2575867 RepID=A0A4U3L4I2_9BACT|nr:YciI family protein [Ilyomonas limi]TKK69234.1 transcription initiation protein [Ilyomonas limi]
MKEFVLLFRQPNYDYRNADPEKMKELGKKWQDWVGGLVAQGKFSNNGIRLAMEGKVLKPGGVVTDGPFVEIKEKLGSFIVVKAENLEEATTLAHGCPAIDEGGSVEIRPVFS